MSVTRFSEAVGYVPDLNGCRKKIVEYCRDSENTIDRLVEENADLIAVLSNAIAGWDYEEVAHHCGVDAETASRVIKLLNK